MQAGGEKAGAKLRFTMEDVDLLRTNVPQITKMTPEVSKDSSIQFDTRTFNFNVSGNYPTVAGIRVLDVGQGVAVGETA